jgi:beta-aspartyl-dipeptidase (metallo-type)
MDTPLLLVQNAWVHAPEPRGQADLLLGGGRILRVEPGIRIPPSYCETLDATGLLAVPGFIDGHVHLAGGGGEGGFASRTPELALSDAIRGGVTTVVGCLGTDGITRSLAALLAKVRGLEAEGLSAFMLTGDYRVPVRTLTGSIERDLLFIDKVIGVGEVALSDHRSTQPTFEELARLAAEARRGGILSGKAGLVNLHLGDGPRGLDLLRRLLAETELLPTQFLPTHMNRNPALFEAGIAYAREGGNVDLTTSTLPVYLEAGEVPCARGLRRMLEAGVEASRITFTSDGQGSLPNFDGEGRTTGVEVGLPTSLFAAVREAVLAEGIPLETALRVITANPARILRLAGKGSLQSGADADLVLLDPLDLGIHTVIARGRVLMAAGRLLARGTFE